MVEDSRDLDIFLDILIELFYSWRPYKRLLAILYLKYHMKRRYQVIKLLANRLCIDNDCLVSSLRWLKNQFNRLGLSRRWPDPPEHQVRSIIRVRNNYMIINWRLYM